jgi:hypothetical protein
LLGTVPTGIPRRILAAIVALGLSGLPALVDHTGEGHVAQHRCRCPAGKHDCACPVCRSAARSARRAGLAALPSCCRSRAAEAIAREEAEEQRRAPADAPCLRSSCDRSDELFPTAQGRELVVLPTSEPPRTPGWMVRVLGPAGTAVSRPLEPEIPPPRRA